MFRTILIEKNEGNAQSAALVDMEDAKLPQGDVAVDIEYSTLNYKDALAITGKMPVVRQFPMVPGIDFAGTVTASSHPDFNSGDKVLLNGHGVGELHWGGLSQKARVSGNWLLKLPSGLTTRQAMSIGTAGYTAMLCVQALQRHGVLPDSGEIIVSGANGGVGSFALMLLARRGYAIVASTGRPEEADHLKRLGAAEVIERATLSSPGKPLQKERWAGAVDTVGSHTLANICASTRYGGVVTACGLAQGMDFNTTVAPFILRGVTLAGIDSVYAPMPLRLAAWQHLAQDIGTSNLNEIASVIPLSEAIDAASELLEGRVRGRLVVDVNA